MTTTAALEDRLVKPADRFAVESRALIDGVELENANGELCGGTFANSFAESCNSVFAPLGVKVGAKRLVETAERYGWNQPADAGRRAPEHHARRRRDREPAGAGLDRHRAGQGAGHRAADGIGGPDGGQPRGSGAANAAAGVAAPDG